MESKERVVELINQLRERGLSNGGSLGRHSGLCDEAADALEELLRYREAEAEYRATIFPVKIGETVSLLRNGHVEVCTVHGFSSKALGCWEVKLYPIVQDWLGNRSITYRVRLSQFNKTWFKYSKKAEAVRKNKEI